MASDFIFMMVAVSVIVLVIQCMVLVWNSRSNKSLDRLTKPSTLSEVFLDWTFYVLILIILSVILRSILCLACSQCERCYVGVVDMKEAAHRFA